MEEIRAGTQLEVGCSQALLLHNHSTTGPHAAPSLQVLS